MNCEILSLLCEKNNITFHSHTYKVPAYNEGKPQLHLSSWSFWQAQLQLQPIFLWVGQKSQSQKTTWLKFAEKLHNFNTIISVSAQEDFASTKNRSKNEKNTTTQLLWQK